MAHSVVAAAVTTEVRASWRWRLRVVATGPGRCYGAGMAFFFRLSLVHRVPGGGFLLAWLLLLARLGSLAAAPAVLHVDFSRTNGVFRSLHGLNKGPLVAGGLVDLTAAQRALGVPFIRLHDCHWPNPDVVDIHAVFPDFAADPARPESYRFARTDEYLAAIRATGAGIIYRLGESIEHTRIKRFVHPPPDSAKWAAICLGLIRHYNEGWADGFHYGINYWEIWNEPENRPAMWTGSDADYFALYETAARAIKAHNPNLKVGGPAVGDTGHFVGSRFVASAFLTNFLGFCREHQAPLDFFSWHCYTDDPAELTARAKAIRACLDDHSFSATESHLNEWNYLPGKDWGPLSVSAPAVRRQQFFDEMAGPEGAAFLVTALLELQDAPVDQCNFYHGEAGPFGIFTDAGLPRENYFGLLAFRELLNTPFRVEAKGGQPGKLAVAAGVSADRTRAAVLISNFAGAESDYRLNVEHLPWSAASRMVISSIPVPGVSVSGGAFEASGSGDALRPVQQITLSPPESIILHLPKPAVGLIELAPERLAPGGSAKE